MIGKVFDGNRILVNDPPVADFIAVAVEKGNSKIVLLFPVAIGLVKCRQGQHQKDNGTGGAERHGFAHDFEKDLLAATNTKTAKKDIGHFPLFAQIGTGIPD